MITEISKYEWKHFFDGITKSCLDCEKRVEVLKNDIGAQILSAGLPLTGFMFEEKKRRRKRNRNNARRKIGHASNISDFNPQKFSLKKTKMRVIPSKLKNKAE